ncbi:Hypothetical predicted protein [Paramuricea clavata]|uniref:Uncharacterized protein n=1 Tax=Paramuricea clavata TaxID=317549 RepID=A0A6S7GZ72_PARCT|nr:Hypothetical predicted protein [Paramuricea clavata]
MASLWFTLTVILYIISEIIAVPLRIAPQKNEYSSLDGNLESGLSGQGIQNIRIRRAANPSPAGCKNGNPFVLANVPQCHVANAKYNAEMKLCLVELLHVPGMPDGSKGYNYIAFNHFLYKIYNATNRVDIVKCPTTSTPKPATTNSGTQPQTKPATTSVPKTTQPKPTTVVKKTELDTNTSGNTPSTAAKQVVVASS